VSLHGHAGSYGGLPMRLSMFLLAVLAGCSDNPSEAPPQARNQAIESAASAAASVQRSVAQTAAAHRKYEELKSGHQPDND